MYRFTRQALHSCLAAALVIGAWPAAQADDTEIFFTTTVSGGDANLMLVLDTSGSMGLDAGVAEPYDSRVSYRRSGTDCDANRIYYRPDDPLNMTPPTSCSGLAYFPKDHNKCAAAAGALDFGSGKQNRAGFYRDFLIRWGGTNNSNRNWRATLSTTTYSNAFSVECKADAGVDGDLSTSNPYPRVGPSTNSIGLWGDEDQQWWSDTNTGTEYVLWSPNLIAYTSRPPTTGQTRMEVVKQAAVNLLSDTTGMNVGLMRYDTRGNGGMVLAPARPIDEGTNRANLINLVNELHYAGNTPLTETLSEAYRYFAGEPVAYGNDSYVCDESRENADCRTGHFVRTESVASSRNPPVPGGERYDSPADASCQNNYIVYLTDGLPRLDNDADEFIEGLGATCDNTGPPGVFPSEAGRCLSGLTRYMYENDLRLNDVEGIQNVQTYFIGFGDDFSGELNASFDYLDVAARAGGGRAFQANSLAALEGAFNSIVSEVVQTNTTFTSPTVAVNAFNRTETLDDLYVAVFQPTLNRHWPGNLKKYRIENKVIVDATGNAAVDPATGFFRANARSYWSSTNDGYEVRRGGAASKIPASASRTVYTYLGTGTPGTPVTLTTGHDLHTSNSGLTEAVLGLGAAGDPTVEELLAWARGTDVQDLEPANGDNTEARRAMGDSIHAQPVVVIYGGTTASPNIDDAAIFMPTNDGYLHAIDADSGEELWAFVPQEVLPQLKILYANETASTKHYTLDGEVTVLKYDINVDGIVDPSAGDRVLLFFGQGRGGSTYYALDVTSKTAPKFLWSSQFPGGGQAWSTPVLARVNVGGATQNSQKLVLIIGGGYDVAEDGQFYVSSASVGNRLFIVDVLSGALLWSAGPDGAADANLELDRMVHSIPSRVAVLDTNSDGYADRMYVGDMAAQLWRFDITNGNNADSLVAGGVIASLGNHGAATPTEENSRRFYYAPDVTAIRPEGMTPFYNIAIGSGYRGHPLNTVIRDRFYSIRDRQMFIAMTQDDYDNFDVIMEDDLQDVTTDMSPVVAANSRGWMLMLNQPGGTWQGEKVLSASSTFDDKILFTTYLPTRTSTNTCRTNSAGTGSNRAYVVNALDATPVPTPNDTPTDPDDPTDPTDPPGPEDRYETLSQGGIAPDVSFLFPEPDKVMCLSGAEVLAACTNFNSRIKTYWRESTAP